MQGNIPKLIKRCGMNLSKSWCRGENSFSSCFEIILNSVRSRCSFVRHFVLRVSREEKNERAFCIVTIISRCASVENWVRSSFLLYKCPVYKIACHGRFYFSSYARREERSVPERVRKRRITLQMTKKSICPKGKRMFGNLFRHSSSQCVPRTDSSSFLEYFSNILFP